MGLDGMPMASTIQGLTPSFLAAGGQADGGCLSEHLDSAGSSEADPGRPSHDYRHRHHGLPG